jgi:uncharacterized protein YhfF
MAKYKYGFLKRSDEEVAKEEAETDRRLAYWENEVKKSKFYNKKKIRAFKKDGTMCVFGYYFRNHLYVYKRT